MSAATPAEIKEVHENRDFWREIGAPLGWTLYGWTYRSGATFFDENNCTVELSASHVRLLDATAACAVLKAHGPVKELTP